jgi:D-hexose-6-phosphate mutarotase
MRKSEPISRVEPTTRQDGMPMLEVTTPYSMAELHRHGATVTHFQKSDEPPLLFLSQCSRFEPGSPIRGGIPICFPWFGQRDGTGVSHGYARTARWDLEAVDHELDGAVRIRLRMPHGDQGVEFPPFAIEYTATVADTLTLELRVTNQSPEVPFEFEECLHTYFHVGDIAQVTVAGLKGLEYLDKLAGADRRKESAEVLRFESEVDRIYLDAPPKLEVRDAALGRRIRIETMDARCAVVWNPWINKSRAMPDYGDDEYQRMVCVESGNVGALRRILKPGESSNLTVRLSTSPL